MDIKNFLNSDYKKRNFTEFISNRFSGFEENNTPYEEPFTEKEKENIDKYKFLGQVELPDGHRMGFFEVITTRNTDIENNRISLNNTLKKYAQEKFLDAAIATFYNENKKVWRLSFIKFSYDENDKQFSTNLKRYTYVLGENIPTKTATEQLQRITKQSSLENIENAFSVEALNDRFFKDYKTLFENINSYLTKNNFHTFDLKDENVRAFSKKLLGRITFLYFLQKKGWLGVQNIWGDGDRNFLQNSFIKTSKDTNFYEIYLTKIFFEALNLKRQDDYFKLLSCKIPFLNGGLFEAKDADKEILDIDNKIFENIFEIFSHYNFTIIEDLPHDSEVAIDPEMLGKVFENLLEDNYKSGKGAFYTPREIVHYMCKQSIYEYLLKEFGEYQDELYDLIFKDNSNVSFLNNKNNAIALTKKIKSLKILDPAIGSGAFPIGLLSEMVGILHNINKTLDDAQTKIEIIENCIYGIDIDASAVEIAKLRFWLSIVVDEDEPKPLPNLDFKIMQGNSLLETINGFDPLRAEDNQGNGARIKRMRDKFHDFYNASSKEEKSKQLTSIEADVNDIFTIALRKRKIKRKEDLKQNNFMSTSTKLVKELEQGNRDIRLIDKILKEYQDTKATTELFLYKIYFSEIVGDKKDENYGFDIVIGNPPYLRVQGIDNDISEQYKDTFDSATGKYDLYVLFVEKGLSLLSKDGVLNYIMPHKWINSGFGQGLRGIAKDTLSKFISFGSYKVFNASTFTSLVWFKNNNQKEYLDYVEVDKDLNTNKELEKYLFGLNDDDYTAIQNDELKSDSWIFTDKQTYNVIEKLKKQPLKLNDIFEYIQVGTQVMGDEIYHLIGKFQENKFIGYSEALNKEVTLEKNIMKPLLLGDDVKRYSPLKNKMYMIYPHYLDNEKTKPYEEDEFQENFPLTYEYLLNFKDDLVKKKIKYKTNPKYWYSLHRARDITLFEQEKILTAETSLGCNMTIDFNNYYTNTQNYSFIMYPEIKESYKFYLSILNSKLLWFFIKNTGSVLSNGYFRFKTNYLNPFPIPKIENIEDTKPFEILVDYIMYLKTDIQKIDKYVDNTYLVKLFEEVVDALVYELYFENEFKQKDIEFIKYAKEYFKPIENLNDEEKTEVIHNSYQLLRGKDNKIRNNLQLMPIRVPSVVPIMESI